MKSFITLIFFLSLSSTILADNIDTIMVKAADLHMNQLQTGNFGYLQYSKKNKESAPTRVTYISFNVKQEPYHNKPAIEVLQQWDTDTTKHRCFTIFDAGTFSTCLQETYWKALGYSMKFDFESKKVEFINVNNKAAIPDSVRQPVINDFEQSFTRYNLNWHADMIIYSLLNYRPGRTFVINYYDPGFGKAEDVMYTVTGDDILTDHNGRKIDCWVLNHFNVNQLPEKGYERFWICKKSNEVLKMEDYGGAGHGYRYKIKLGLSGD